MVRYSEKSSTQLCRSKIARPKWENAGKYRLVPLTGAAIYSVQHFLFQRRSRCKTAPRCFFLFCFVLHTALHMQYGTRGMWCGAVGRAAEWTPINFMMKTINVAFGCVALRCVALRCGAVRCVAMRCGAVRCGSPKKNFQFCNAAMIKDCLGNNI